MISVGDHNAGAGAFGGHIQTASAHPFEWSAEDSLAAANVRLHYELDEANARIAVLEQEKRILSLRAEKAEADAAAWRQEAIDNLKQFSRAQMERDHWRAAAAQAVADRDANKATADKLAEQLADREAIK